MPRLLVAVVTLALPTTALAHVEPKPPFVSAATDTSVSFDMPNERESATMTELVLETPSDVQIVDASAPAGWMQDFTADRVVFSDGKLPPGTTLAFAATLRAERAGTSTLRAVQRFDDGGEVPWKVELSVLPASGAAAPKQHPERAIIAAAVGVALVGLSLLLMHRLRRRSLQES